ncbi:MAG TPA: insulinase family protein [Candidatus Gallacutalibacter stercoravium]|nr:insulinase family protein [Candidatus Gallacutalibacter stercoravium]
MAMEKITLPNGLRILLEPRQEVRTACFGIWAKSGPIYETPEINGISHLIEHMVFKGTSSRSAKDIAEQMDAIGGQMNAYTAKDYTCFYARSLAEHVEQAFEILADMVKNPRFGEKELRLEQAVVREEIGMSKDMPDDLVLENLYRQVWGGSTLGLPILGDDPSGLSAADLRSYMSRAYAPQRLVVSICGQFDRERFLSCVTRYFGDLQPGPAIAEPGAVTFRPGCTAQSSEQEQTHICVAIPGFDFSDERRNAMSLLNLITGGSASSRLFQRIREQLGLAYSVDSDTVSYAAGGMMVVQTAVNPSVTQRALQEILAVLNELRGGVTPEEFSRAKEQLKSGLLMGMESVAARAGRMGRGELLKNEVLTEDELVARLEAVTLPQVNDLAREVFELSSSRVALSIVGPDQEEKYVRLANQVIA